MEMFKIVGKSLKHFGYPYYLLLVAYTITIGLFLQIQVIIIWKWYISAIVYFGHLTVCMMNAQKSCLVVGHMNVFFSSLKFKWILISINMNLDIDNWEAWTGYRQGANLYFPFSLRLSKFVQHISHKTWVEPMAIHHANAF